jgi:hypothetical protein
MALPPSWRRQLFAKIQGAFLFFGRTADPLNQAAAMAAARPVLGGASELQLTKGSSAEGRKHLLIDTP